MVCVELGAMPCTADGIEAHVAVTQALTPRQVSEERCKNGTAAARLVTVLQGLPFRSAGHRVLTASFRWSRLMIVTARREFEW